MALRSRFPLDGLLKLANLARSTFYYQVSALQKPDKYASLKTRSETSTTSTKGDLAIAASLWRFKRKSRSVKK
jgi:hypothetical protein